MDNVKGNLDKFMEEIKKDNPNANWANLLTGIGILVLIAAFSIWYFGKTPVGDGGGSISDIFKSSDSEDVVLNDESPVNENVVVVQEGEGLWHVAERVCGNGEVYTYVAAENNLSVWSSVIPGQELVVTCDYGTN